MTALHALGLLAAFVFSALALSGTGRVFLRILKVECEKPLDRSLLSIALGVVVLELAVSAGEFAPTVPTGVRVACAAVTLVSLLGLRGALADLRECFLKFAQLTGSQRILAIALLAVLALQALAALAPLTGSDALHYHFAVPQLYLREGFQAPWPLLHGFFCGLGHQLILAGLAPGSGRLAQLWLFLGGAVAVLATLRVVQLCVAKADPSNTWPWLAALAFALTPVSVWQISAAGAPDIWLCALVPLCWLSIVRAAEVPQPGAIVLAGILAGAVAGSKYTGILLAAALLAGFALAVRSFSRSVLFFASAAVVGIWPYLRNWIWTGDPFFPLAAGLRRPGIGFNATAIQSIAADTGATHSFRLWELMKFPFFASVDEQHLGAWQLLGPLVLAFAPIAIPQLRKSVAGRLALIVWITGALAIGASSGMARFTLPLLPLALGASVAGVALATENRWRVLRALSGLTLISFCAAGFAAMAGYSHRAWSAGLGRVSDEAYLAANAPDYQRSQFVNREMLRRAETGRVMVFFRHLYYLRVSYFNGDPNDSWEVNPATLNSSAAGWQARWQDLFTLHQIRWVLKAPDDPPQLKDALLQLEEKGVLTPCASGEVEDFSGNRIEGIRVRVPITLLCVHR